MVKTENGKQPGATGMNIIGLRKRPTYEEAINYLQTDQEIIRYPNRVAKQTRESPWMTQLDPDANDDVATNIDNEKLLHNTLRQIAAGLGQAHWQIGAQAGQPPPPPPPPPDFNANYPHPPPGGGGDEGMDGGDGDAGGWAGYGGYGGAFGGWGGRGNHPDNWGGAGGAPPPPPPPPPPPAGRRQPPPPPPGGQAAQQQGGDIYMPPADGGQSPRGEQQLPTLEQMFHGDHGAMDEHIRRRIRQNRLGPYTQDPGLVGFYGRQAQNAGETHNLGPPVQGFTPSGVVHQPAIPTSTAMAAAAAADVSRRRAAADAADERLRLAKARGMGNAAASSIGVPAHPPPPKAKAAAAAAAGSAAAAAVEPMIDYAKRNAAFTTGGKQEAARKAAHRERWTKFEEDLRRSRDANIERRRAASLPVPKSGAGSPASAGRASGTRSRSGREGTGNSPASDITGDIISSGGSSKRVGFGTSPATSSSSSSGASSSVRVRLEAAEAAMAGSSSRAGLGSGASPKDIGPIGTVSGGGRGPPPPKPPGAGGISKSSGAVFQPSAGSAKSPPQSPPKSPPVRSPKSPPAKKPKK